MPRHRAQDGGSTTGAETINSDGTSGTAIGSTTGAETINSDGTSGTATVGATIGGGGITGAETSSGGSTNGKATRGTGNGGGVDLLTCAGAALSQTVAAQHMTVFLHRLVCPQCSSCCTVPQQSWRQARGRNCSGQFEFGRWLRFTRGAHTVDASFCPSEQPEGVPGQNKLGLNPRRMLVLTEKTTLNQLAEALTYSLKSEQRASLDEIEEKVRRVDGILITQAFTWYWHALQRFSFCRIDVFHSSCVAGTYNMTHMAFPALKASKFGGIGTSITATLHRTATWYQTAPVAAKVAIEALTRNLALEWGEHGIRCNCVAPGPVQGTPGLEKPSGGQGKTMKFPWIPLQRAATKAEIASTCIFCAFMDTSQDKLLTWTAANGSGRCHCYRRMRCRKVREV